METQPTADHHEETAEAGKLVVAADRPLNCDQAYYVVSAGANLERPIAGQFREWLLDEASLPA
ncbi:hypothetical protein [Halomonas sp. NO4]|uniref:hypothetical protein n=1 Tax=Halomonas sp. NO4 TaxID=2484813 RepID=UPI0013D8BA71|nr:hypothetical protein [Halomonas sp. NO4]